MREPRSRNCNFSSRPFRAGGFLVAVVALLFCSNIRPGWAETEVWGHPDAMYLRADNARVSEVLRAISAQFKLRYPSNLHFEVR